jgi:hypothetical protein
MANREYDGNAKEALQRSLQSLRWNCLGLVVTGLTVIALAGTFGSYSINNFLVDSSSNRFNAIPVIAFGLGFAASSSVLYGHVARKLQFLRKSDLRSMREFREETS